MLEKIKSGKVQEERPMPKRGITGYRGAGDSVLTPAGNISDHPDEG